MSGLSEERRKEIEQALADCVAHRNDPYAYHPDEIDEVGAFHRKAQEYVRDLLAESAALRTEIDRLETLYDDAVGEISSARHVIDELTFEANRLRAPASPDDLARVANTMDAERIEWIRQQAEKNRRTGYRAGGAALLQVEETRLDWKDVDWLLARLTPPTGTA